MSNIFLDRREEGRLAQFKDNSKAGYLRLFEIKRKSVLALRTLYRLDYY
jgi:hypothetical protein